jgi:hypothetical protein
VDFGANLVIVAFDAIAVFVGRLFERRFLAGSSSLSTCWGLRLESIE